jgi:hypothetical protein
MIVFDSTLTAGYGILAENGGLSQIIIYVVVGAMMILGNISKARAAKTQKKRTRHTDDPRSKPKPSKPLGQRIRSQELPPRSRVDKTEKSPRYHPPGGFAEALLDEKLEETLKKRSKRAVKSYAADRAQETSVIKPIESTEAMAHDLESMGHLETLDAVGGSSLEDHWVAENLISIDGPDDLAKAVVYAEILSKPVGLRGF